MDRIDVSADAAPCPSPVDFRRMESILDTDEEKTAFLKIFFETAEDLVAEMKTAVTCRSQTKWGEAAHSLKGAAGNIGMAPLGKLCLNAERANVNDDFFCRAHILKIEDEIARAKAFIAEIHPPLLPKGI